MKYYVMQDGERIASINLPTDVTSNIELVPAPVDRLPDMPEGYSQLDDVRKAQSEPCPWHQPRGRKHSTRASSWL